MPDYLVEDNSHNILLIQSAFRKANIPHLLQVVGDRESAILYLFATDSYADRERYPPTNAHVARLKNFWEIGS